MGLVIFKKHGHYRDNVWVSTLVQKEEILLGESFRHSHLVSATHTYVHWVFLKPNCCCLNESGTLNYRNNRGRKNNFVLAAGPREVN